jgi:outer membrane protein OmpA-like peptidoglycan-associated protein
MARFAVALWIGALAAGCSTQDVGSSAVFPMIPDSTGCKLCLQTSDIVVLFAPGSAELDDSRRPGIDDEISAIAGERSKGARRISIVTHAEWIAPDQVDLDLARRRAATIRALLIERGVPADLIHTDVLGPHDPYSEPACRDQAEINMEW